MKIVVLSFKIVPAARPPVRPPSARPPSARPPVRPSARSGAGRTYIHKTPDRPPWTAVTRMKFLNIRTDLKGGLSKGGVIVRVKIPPLKKIIFLYILVFAGSLLPYSRISQLQDQVADRSHSPGMRRQRVKRSRVAQTPSKLLGISTGQQHARSELFTNGQISCKDIPWLC